MSWRIKPGDKWLAEFKELGEKHGKALAKPFEEFFADKILLTREEIIEAREERTERLRCSLFLTRNSHRCNISRIHDAECSLCLKLTEFAKGGENE